MKLSPHPLIAVALLALTAHLGTAREEESRDILYKSTPEGELRLDLYYPDRKSGSPHPLVIYTHGGGWAAGSRKAATVGGMGKVVEELTREGFVVASVDYRLCTKGGNVTIRTCVTDSKDALRFLVKNHEKYGIDPRSVFTFGDSAGGQIAQMLLLSGPEEFPGDESLAGQNYHTVAGVSWYGPCDFEKTELFNGPGQTGVRDRFGGRIIGPTEDAEKKLAAYREVSPVNYLRSDSPPLLMIQGDMDTTIPVHHAHYMEERAEASGAPVEVLIIEGAGHNWRGADRAVVPDLNEIVSRTVRFLAEHRKNPR